MHIANNFYVCNAFTPIADASGGVTGIRVPVRDAGHVTLLLHLADSAATLTATLNKATAASGGSTAVWAALSTTSGSENIWQKTGTDNTILLTVDAWARVVGASTSTFTTTAASGHTILMELDPDTLGATGSSPYNHIYVSTTGGTAASVLYGVWFLSAHRYAQDLMTATLP